MKNPQGLCHRCEHRARNKETGMAPRYECGITETVFGCYMYEPVRPLIIRKQKGDKRPLLLNALSARVERMDRQPEITLIGKRVPGGLLVYWLPKGVFDNES